MHESITHLEKLRFNGFGKRISICDDMKMRYYEQSVDVLSRLTQSMEKTYSVSASHLHVRTITSISSHIMHVKSMDLKLTLDTRHKQARKHEI